MVELICKLEPQEFIGVCKILGVKLTEDESEEKEEVLRNVRPTEDLIEDVIDKIAQLSKVRAKNLRRLLKAATKKRD